MSQQTSNLIQFYISPETTAGTYLAPVTGEYLPHGGGSFNRTKEMVTLSVGMGNISNTKKQRISKLMGSGTIPTPLGARMAGNLLMAIMGKVPVTTGAGPYAHAYTVQNDNSHKTFSIGRIDAQGGQSHFTYGMLSSWSLSYEANGDPVMLDTEWMSKDESAQSDVTPAYETTEDFFYPDMITLELQDDGTGFTGANVDVKSFTLSGNKNLQEITKGGTASVQGFKNGEFTVEGSLTIDKQDSVAFDEAFTNTDKEMKLTITSGTNILTFTLGNLNFGNPEVSTDLGGLEQLTRSFIVNNAVVEFTASLTNSVTAYPRT